MARTTWTLGGAGAQTLTATSLGQSATFTATAVPLLSIYSGNNQQSSPLTPVPDSLVVRAARPDGSPVAGVTVQWSTLAGTVSPTTSVTDAQGLARTSYVLQGGAGTWQVTARAPAYGNTGVVFTERGVNPVLVPASDNPTTGTAGVPLTVRVRLTHADGRPFPGQVIQFTGPGTRTPATPVTDANGYATFQWTLPSPGTYTITAYDAAYTGVSTHVTATVAAP